MNPMDTNFKEQIAEKDAEITRLSKLLSHYQKSNPDSSGQIIEDGGDSIHDQNYESSQLTNKEIGRYSRQLILPEIGVKGQVKLKNTRVLVVGAGGLGCPSAVYLAAAGVGTIGVVDYDDVEISNLHRQVLHTESRVGLSKASSVTQSCKSLNSSINLIAHKVQLNSRNALETIQRYDIVLDATDNVATRYLLNDACVLAEKPLVSGSALRFEGQLTVYNYQGGPCYRCLFPKPPPPETVTNCSDGGVLGVVPGIIGSLQALEAIKISVGMGTSFSQRLLLFDAVDGTFRTPKLRPKSKDCSMCGENRTINELIDYEQFCGAKATDKDSSLEILDSSHRISATGYADLMKTEEHILVDVRQAIEIEICQLPHPALNIPINSVLSNTKSAVDLINQAVLACNTEKNVPVVVVCRRGNDSQLALQALLEFGQLKTNNIKDIRSGLYGWSKHVDPNFPIY